MYRVTNCICRIYKSLFLIILLLWGVMPLLARKALQISGINNAELILQRYYSFFYPGCLIILAAIVFYPYIEGEGRELLYVHQRMYLLEAFIPFIILTVLMMISVYFYWKEVLNHPFQFCIKNMIILFCFTSLCYFFVYAFHSITVMIIICFLFFLAAVLNPLRILNVLQCEEIKQTNWELLYSMKEYILISFICLIIAIILNKIYSKYTVL